MKKFLSKTWLGVPILAVIVVLLVATTAVLASPFWQSVHLVGSGNITVTTTGSRAAFDGTITADSNPIGSVALGATLNIGGVATIEHTLGITGASVTNIQPNIYGFKITPVPANTTALTTYFTGLTGAQLTRITSEINGTAPFFFLNISGSTVSIYDGFQRGLNSSSTAPLVINDNYPVANLFDVGSVMRSQK